MLTCNCVIFDFYPAKAGQREEAKWIRAVSGLNVEGYKAKAIQRDEAERNRAAFLDCVVGRLPEAILNMEGRCFGESFG